jgi:hypothetical protein
VKSVTGYKKQPMPGVGEAFLVPLAKGANTFCWVVRLHDKRKVYGGRKLGNYVLHSFVIACSAWTGSGAPTAADLASREVRVAYDDFATTLKPIGSLALVASSPPPKRWRKLGTLQRPQIDVEMLVAGTSTAPDGTTTPVPSQAGFTGLQDSAARAWALGKNAKRVLAAEAAADAAVDSHNAAEDAKDAIPIERRRTATLAQLLKLDLLPEWKGLVPAAHRKKAAALLVEGVAELGMLKRPGRAAKLAVIETLVGKLNAWNDRVGIIETPEREALCTAIDDIGHAAGLRGKDLAGPYRDW